MTRKPTPAPTLAQPEDPRDEEPGPLSITEQTGASDLPEPSSAEHANDIIEVDSSSGVPSAQITADVDIGALAIFPPFLLDTVYRTEPREVLRRPGPCSSPQFL